MLITISVVAGDGWIRMSLAQHDRCMSGYGPGDMSPREVVEKTKSGLQDMPKPDKEWQKFYKQRTGKWNMFLAASAAFAGFTAFMVCETITKFSDVIV